MGMCAGDNSLREYYARRHGMGMGNGPRLSCWLVAMPWLFGLC